MDFDPLPPQVEAMKTVDMYYYLGVRFFTGQGAPQSYTEAVKYFELAANEGHPAAQYNLGLCYENGHGVPQSYADAAKYYKLAADYWREETIKLQSGKEDIISAHRNPGTSL